MIRRDAGVDHRDADASAGVTVLLARRESADGSGGARHFAGDFAIDVHALDVRVVGETAEKRVGNAARIRLQQLQASTRSATSALDAIGAVLVLIVVELNDDVGFAVAVGLVVQRAIELVVPLFLRFLLLLLLFLGFTVAWARLSGDRNGGKRPDKESNEEVSAPHRLLPGLRFVRKENHGDPSKSNRRAKRLYEALNALYSHTIARN